MYLVNNKRNPKAPGIDTFVDVPGLLLMPGINRVKTDEWEKLLQNDTVVARVKAGDYEAQKVDDKAWESLAVLPEKRAVDVARGTVHPIILKEWLAGEKRETVRKAIKENLAEIDARTKANSESDDPKPEGDVDADDDQDDDATDDESK